MGVVSVTGCETAIVVASGSDLFLEGERLSGRAFVRNRQAQTIPPRTRRKSGLNCEGETDTQFVGHSRGLYVFRFPVTDSSVSESIAVSKSRHSTLYVHDAGTSR
jgi:hypothetical protein